MPTEAENAQYLYTVLTANGPPAVDWNAVAKDLDLKLGATTKRWSRLQQAFRDGKDPGPTAYQLLWSCFKYSARDGPSLPWGEIAKKCNTTPGAASKRYSRMKLAYERGNDASPTRGKGKSTGTSKDAGAEPATAVKDKDTASGAGSKRKRGPATVKKATPKATPKAETLVKPEPDNSDEDEEAIVEKKPAHARPRGPKSNPKLDNNVNLEPSSDATNDEAPIAKPKTKSKLKPAARTRGNKSTSKDDARYKPSTSASPSEDEKPAVKKKKKLSAQNKPRPAIKPSTNSAPVESPEPVKSQAPFYLATTPEREKAHWFPYMVPSTEKSEGYGDDEGTLADRHRAGEKHEDEQREDQGKEDEHEIQAKTIMRSSDLPFPWEPSHAWSASAAPANDMPANADSMLADPEVENDGLVAAWLDDVRVDEGAEILDEFLDIVG